MPSLKKYYLINLKKYIYIYINMYIYISSCIYTKRELWFFKVVAIHVCKIAENSDLFLFPTKARFPNPETSSIRGCLSSSHSKQSERRTHPQH